MRYSLAVLIIALSATSFLSCKKKKTEEKIFSGSVEISNPHEGDTVTGNFAIAGTITGNMEMHGYYVGVYRTDTQDLVFENQHADHSAAYTISETVTHSLTDTIPLKVVIEAVADHEGTTVTKTVHFTYRP